MKLHVFPPSPNARKVMLVNELLGLGAELVIVNLLKGEQYEPAFTALNPNNKMPVLEMDDGTTLWESNAIINRMAAMTDTSIWPKSNQRYDIMRWQYWEAAHWAPACAKFIQRHLFGNENVDMEEAAQNFHRFAKVLDGHLDGRDWLSGDEMTTADVAVSAILYYRDRCQMPHDDYANIGNWIGRMEALDAWQASNPPQEL